MSIFGDLITLYQGKLWAEYMQEKQRNMAHPSNRDGTWDGLWWVSFPNTLMSMGVYRQTEASAVSLVIVEIPMTQGPNSNECWSCVTGHSSLVMLIVYILDFSLSLLYQFLTYFRRNMLKDSDNFL